MSNANKTDKLSLSKKGIETNKVALIKFVPVKMLYCKTPNMCNSNIPIKAIGALAQVDLQDLAFWQK